MKPLPTTIVVLIASLLATAGAAVSDTAPSREFVESWVLVRLRAPLAKMSGVPAFEATLAQEKILRVDGVPRVSLRDGRFPEALRRHGLDRTYRFHVEPGRDIPALVERLSRSPHVAYAEPDFVLQQDAIFPDDPLFPQQWALDQPSDADIDAPEAWEISTGGPVVVAVIDSGIDHTHVEFEGEGKIVEGWNFVADSPDTQDYNAHGTAMSSLIAANTDNAAVMAGVCWQCRIMPLNAGIWSSAAAALVWATDHGARVVNISQGAASPSLTFRAALAYAYDAGVTVVASAGNTGLTPIQYPARYVETIAVGATDGDDRRAAPFCFNSNPGSCFGPRLDVSAPGDLILNADSSTAPHGEPDGYYTGCGTSQSAAFVSGIAGVLRSVHPSVGRLEARELIRAGAEDQVGDPAEDVAGFDPYHGWGRVNLERTLHGAVSATSLHVDGTQATRPFLETPSPIADSYDFVRGDLGALAESPYGVELGEVVCLEDDSPDADTAGHEDQVDPSPGEGFFYLSRPAAPAGAGSYGGSSRNRDRRTTVRAWTEDGGQDGAELGFEVAGAGDVNGDGYDDVIAGAKNMDDDQADEGAAFLYYGSETGLQPTPPWTVWGDQTGSWFGRSVGPAGDVNGDGFDDVVVGASFHTNGESEEGRAYVFYGSENGPGLQADWVAESDQAFARFGERVTSAGDVNDDGFDDLLVTAPQYDGGQQNEGRAYVYFGSVDGLGDVPWTFETNQAEARLGFGGGSSGDVNGDGYDDLVVGAHRYDGPDTDEGRLYLFMGSASGPSGFPVILETNSPFARLGRSSATAGDVNGDGYDDLIAGAVFHTGSETEEGAVFVFHGSALGISSSPSWSHESGQAYARLGIAAATAGDVNGDGYVDVIAGAYTYDSERSDEGGAWVWLGSPTGLAADPHWVEFGRQTGAGFGVAVAAAGNVDGDPYDDVVVGAYGHDAEHPDEGRVFLYRGSATGMPTTSDCSE